MPVVKSVLLVLAVLAGLAAFAVVITAFGIFLLASRTLRGQENVPLDQDIYGPYLDEMERGRAWFAAQGAERVTLAARDGITLAAQLLPAENAVGTMLLMHGYRATGERDFSCVLPFYHALGYNILLPDERACGASGGKFITFGVKERYDCADWAAFAAARFGAELPLFLGGISMGATTVLLATALPLPKSVCGVVADCGFTTPAAIISSVAGKVLGHCPRIVLALASGFAQAFAGWSFFGCSAVEAMRENARIPVLFLHGEEDAFVPPAMTRENYAACAAEKTLLLVPGAGHGLSYLVDRARCEQTLTDFLARCRASHKA